MKRRNIMENNDHNTITNSCEPSDTANVGAPLDIPDLPTVRPLSKPKYSLTDSICAWVCFLLGFIFTRYVCGYAGGLWGGIFWAAVGALGAVYVRLKALKTSPAQIAVFIIAELFCLTPIFCANGFVNTLAAMFSFALIFYLAVSVSGAALFGKHFVLDALSGVFARPFISFTHSTRAALGLFRGGKDGKGSRTAVYVLLGLLTAIPLTIVVVVLLMFSDSAFENAMDNFFARFSNISFSLFWQILFAIPVGMYLFGSMFSSAKPAWSYSEEAPVYRFLPPPIAYTAVTPICVFYLIYIITQLGYFTAAFGGELPEGYNYSEFARRGFFELCVIAVINLCVITLMQALVKRHEGDRRPKALRVYTIIISVFTLLLIASALSKMLLYIKELGMTQLRIYTSWFMILLAIIFVMIIVLQIREFAFWKVLFAAFSVMMGVLCFGNIDGAIARYNVSAYQSGALEEFDIQAMYPLGAAAVKPVSELLNTEDTEMSEKIEYSLSKLLYEIEQKDDFAYFSIQKITAEKICESINITPVSYEAYWRYPD